MAEEHPPPGAPPPGETPPPPGPSWSTPPSFPTVPGAVYPPVPGTANPAGPPPYTGPPVHKPGVVPLRPLTLGDMFGGATLTIRRNPMSTMGLAALVTLGFMLVPIVATVVVGLTGGLPNVNPFDPASTTTAGDPTAGLGINVANIATGVFSWLAGIVVTGLVIRVVEQAVVGRKVSAGEAWARSRGRLLPLLGLSLLALVVLLVVLAVPIGLGVTVGLLASSVLLAVLLGVLSGTVGLVALTFLYVRYFLLAAPNLVIEGNGIFAALRRAGQLSQGQFWRLFGISLLAALAAGAVGQVAAIPFVLLGTISIFVLPGSWGLVSLLLASYLGSVVTGAVTGPFTGSVTGLQYFDQRFRKEGHDIELLNQTLGRSSS